MAANLDDVRVRCMAGRRELQPSSFSLSLPFYLCLPLFSLILSLCIPLPPPLFSYPKYRIMTQFSWAVRASREMVTIATTAPVLLSRPTVAGARVHGIVLATLAKSCMCLCVCVCVCGCGWGIGRCHYFQSLDSHLISVGVVCGSECCSNHINILYTNAFHAAVQGAHKVITRSVL